MNELVSLVAGERVASILPIPPAKAAAETSFTFHEEPQVVKLVKKRRH